MAERVFYNPDGSVNTLLNDKLENQARIVAGDKFNKYIDQREICDGRNAPFTANPIEIIIDDQVFYPLYCSNVTHEDYPREQIQKFQQQQSLVLPVGVSRQTLMRCSSLADEFFTFNPGESRLHLPVNYPRKHMAGNSYDNFAKEVQRSGNTLLVPGSKYDLHPDSQMAYIRPQEIDDFILPWMRQIEEWVKTEKAKKTKSKKPVSKNDAGSSSERAASLKEAMDLFESCPKMNIPKDDLVKMIHLYNAMLQLGVPGFIQTPLIDAIISKMHGQDLQNCHLDLLEITVGRFYSRGLAILDPVINHFIGTYAFRKATDRAAPESPAPPSLPESLSKYKVWTSPKPDKHNSVKRGQKRKSPDDDDDRKAKKIKTTGHSGTQEAAVQNINNGGNSNKDDQERNSVPDSSSSKSVIPTLTKREFLTYRAIPANRPEFPRDTYVLPPQLPVLGHCIRHWSGLLRNGDQAAAFTGFPLNPGVDKKYYRARPQSPLREEYAHEFKTHRLTRDVMRLGPGENRVEGDDEPSHE